MRRVLPIAAICLLAGCNLFSSSSTNNGDARDVGASNTPNNTSNQPNNSSNQPNNTPADMGTPDQADTPDMDVPPVDMRTADMDVPPDMEATPDMDVMPDMEPVEDFGWDRSGRVAHGLLMYYSFEAGTGTTVIDRAPRGGTPSLTLGPTATWVAGRNGVHVDGPERITGAAAGAELWDGVVPREEMTVEVWVKPDNLTQDGPARIVTFSEDSSNRNFTIGQNAAQYVVRLSVNDSEFSSNGTPSLDALTPVTLAVTHIAFTYDGLDLRLFVNGVQAGSSLRTGGLQHWDRNYAFLLGNENVSSRPWAGEIYKLAVYDRALTPPEVQQNFLLGSEAE